MSQKIRITRKGARYLVETAKTEPSMIDVLEIWKSGMEAKSWQQCSYKPGTWQYAVWGLGFETQQERDKRNQ